MVIMIENGINDKKKETLAEEVIDYIRKRLSRKMNYLAPALYYLSLLPVEENEAMATDGYYLFYNADYVLKTYQSFPQKLQMEYMHIVSHCMLGHIQKRKGVHQKLYDSVADYCVTLFIKNINVNGLREKTSLDHPGESKKWKEIFNQKGIIGVYEYLCNNPKAGADLVHKADDLAKDNHVYWNKIHPAAAKAQAENLKAMRQQGKSMEAWMKDYRRKVLEAWKALMNLTEEISRNDCKTAKWGMLKGDQSGVFEMSGENEISYKEFLNRFLSLQEKNKIDLDSFDYTWYSIGLKEYHNIPIIEPLEYTEKNTVDDLIIALDTSGSCIDSIKRFLRETYNILSDMDLIGGINLRILQCDSEVCDDRRIRSADELPDFQSGFRINGFGGTDFRPVFRYIEGLKQKGEIKKIMGLLYFSDGFGEFPEEPTDYETVFLLPPNDFVASELPRWITRVDLTDQDISYDS